MENKTEEDQAALKLAELIEDAVNEPEKTIQRMEEKTGTKGIIGTIIDFIKDYKNKEPSQSNEEWLEKQFAKPEYVSAWKGSNAEKERKAAVQGLVQGVVDYENAKKSLRMHIEMGGTRESWLAEQIEIGAENNSKAPEEYAKEVYEGISEAMEENAEFLLGGKIQAKAVK